MPESLAILRQELAAASRAVSTATVLFHQLIAEAVGLNSSDHKCLDLLLREGVMTAGELAERSGFTTGAITGIINRLAARGFVRRVADREDRRSVRLEPVPDRVHKEMGPLFQPFLQRTAVLHAHYRTAELKAITRFLRESEAILRTSSEELAARRDAAKS